MKKFVFTNEKYRAIKENEYDRLKLDMKNIDRDIDMALNAQNALTAEFEAERTRFNAACKEGVGSGELLCYQGFFDFIQERREEIAKRLAELRKKKQELTHRLARLLNELKVLDEMREEQYQAYCKEVAAEEAKELDSHMSFTIYEKAV